MSISGSRERVSTGPLSLVTSQSAPATGDMAQAQALAALRARIEEINGLFGPKVARTGLDAFLQSRDLADLKPGVQKRVTCLKEDTQRNLTDKITSREAQAILGDKRRRLLAAELTARELGANFLRTVMLRAEPFRGAPVYLFDVDGTITDPEEQARMGYPRVNFEDPLLLGSGIFDRLMQGDDDLRPIMHAAGWGQMIRQYPEVFAEAGTHIPLREGMDELFEYAREEGAETHFITTNFRPLVEAVRSRISGAEYTMIHAIDADTTRSTQKGDIIRWLVVQYPDSPIHYFGDGSSDRDALRASDQLVAIHALRGSSFERMLREKGVPHFTFTDGHDMRRNLMRSKPSNAKKSVA